MYIFNKNKKTLARHTRGRNRSSWRNVRAGRKKYEGKKCERGRNWSERKRGGEKAGEEDVPREGERN